MASYEELRRYARIIRNETKSSANTALRIGEMYLNIIDKMEDVDDRFKDFLTGTDTDTIINRWKELEAFLNGYTETTTLADLLSVKADKATTLAGYGITNAYTKTEVDNKITSVNTSVTTLQTTVSGHTTSINSLQDTVSGHTTSINSLQGYFTNGVANFASRLSDGAEYKAWGKVFFKDGKPVNVSGEGTFTQVNADSVLLKGKARLSYDSNLNALLLTRNDGTAVHFLASGAVATRGLGEIEEGGGGTGTGVDLLNVPSDIIPSVGGSYSLGTSGKPWKELFVGDIQSENIMPSSHYTYSLGADENRWSKIYGVDIYATRFTMDGEAVATRNWVNSQDFAKISDLTSINNSISSLQASTFTGANNPEGKGYTLTWFTQSGGGRNVTIPAYGEVGTVATDGLAGIGQNVALVDQWLIADLMDYIAEVAAGGNVDLSNYVTLNSAQTISGRKTFTGGITASHLYSVEYLDSSALTINAEEVDFTYDGDDSNILVGLINGYKPLTLGNTSFSPALTSGTVIGTITIGGESKTIFAPNGGSVDLSNYVTLDSEQNITGGKYFSDLNANSIYLQGFELKPYSLDGRTPDRLMYDGYVLLDEYNYSEYLDSAYVKKSGDTMKGTLRTQHVFPSATNAYECGTSGNRWSRFYSVRGNFSGQITSSVADGTAPFVVASKTEVANLHSATATKLHTARTIAISGAVTGTATAFDGSSNVSINTTSVDANYVGGYFGCTYGKRVYYGHHPENRSGTIPFLYNDLAHLVARGGSCTMYTTTDTDYTQPTLTNARTIGSDYTKLFDGSPSYFQYSVSSSTDVVVVDITLPKAFSYTTQFYIDFGTANWRAKDVSVYVWNNSTNNSEQVYTLKGSITNDNKSAAHVSDVSYSYTDTSGTKIQGFNCLRVVLTNFVATSPRIAQIGLIQNSSLGLRYGYMSRGIDDQLYRSLTPAKNSMYDLGSSLNRWKVIYGQSLDLSGNATIGGSLTTGGNILPSTNNGANIGQSDRRWLNGYIDNLYSDVISADTFVPRNSQYISVKAMSLDLYECELYGYDSDNLDVWNIDYSGNAYFQSVTQTSDVRYKSIKEYIHLELSDIAAAPTFKFAWANDTDGKTHIGTSAQYWQEIASELVTENKKTGKLGLDYSTAALVSAVSIAREVNTMKMWQTSTTDRIEELEERVKALEEENKALRELLNNK